MIYKSLDTIPYKVFIKICEDAEKHIRLLTDDISIPDEELYVVWADLCAEQQASRPEIEKSKVFGIDKELAALELKYKLIKICLHALGFDWSDEIRDILKLCGYKITKATMFEDMDRIDRESSGITIKINQLRKMLPKAEESGEKKNYSAMIDQTFAFYAFVLGFDFDYNTVSYTKVLALQLQVDAKIKMIESQNTRNKDGNR